MSDPWIWRYERSIPSDAAAGRQVVEDVLAQLEAQHWLQADIFGIHLAMEEALINAIHHGNRLDRQKRVYVDCRMSADRIRIEISDEGAGFDPARLPDPTCAEGIETPSGRGVMLMRAFMSRVDYNAKGNQVILEKDRAKE